MFVFWLLIAFSAECILCGQTVEKNLKHKHGKEIENLKRQLDQRS